MFKGIKKKFTANRSSGRNRRLVGGRDSGETTPREPPDRGGTKPISPRQIHPSDQVLPVPYSRRSIERSRTAPMKSNQENIMSRYDAQPFYGAQRHTLQGPAYPTSPNICVTGGKIEFVMSTSSPISSDASVTSSSTITASPSKSPLDYSKPKHQTYFSSPRNYRKKEENNYLTSPKSNKQNTNINSRPPFSIYCSSEFKNSSPTSSTASRSSRRKGRLEGKKNIYDPKSNSLMQHSLPPRSPDSGKHRSATMPVREEANEIEVLKKENSEVKSQLLLMQKEFLKLDSKVKSLQREKHERSQIEGETNKEQLSQYQNIVERCNALENANSQLQEEAQTQRQEYEKCLDNVALQVVQAIIVQKKQQEECDRLSKKVQVLQRQNTNLSSLLANKAKSLSPSYAQYARQFEELSHCSQSLPNTLLRKEKKQTSKDSCSQESELSESSDENSQSKSELTDQVDKADTACWYDVIKAIQNGANKNEYSTPEPTKLSSSSATSDPSNLVQTGCHPGSSHIPVIANRPSSSYTLSSNHQELIVNSLTSCVTSYTPTHIQAPSNGKYNKIVSKTLTKLPHINLTEKNITEGITKDEGYSTMSSDVQTEPKVSVSTIATVEEEKVKATDSDPETEKNESAVEQTEYVDGLRVVYDAGDVSSDVFLIAIHDKKDGIGDLVSLKPARVDDCRSLSESDLTNSSVLAKNFLRKANALDQSSLPYVSVNKKNLINLQLRSLKNGEISKRARNCRRPENNAFSLERNSDRGDTLNSAHKSSSHSPSTYSHAEMEDWSLELSAEDLSTPANSIVSASNFPSGNQSVPDSSNFQIEDQTELSWNVANYSNRTLDWQYEKTASKPWLNNNSRSMISPKSGCSDQPAVWSSIEHLSSCSDVASKCSTDIENFCDQLCKLPELKRMSASSVDNATDCVNNLTKLRAGGSLEDNSELNENIEFDNAFTRDFYRLIKFGSTKSLAESSRSLAPSEISYQTLDKLHSRDSSINKTFTSVLGFIAEQQKYCRQREILDGNSKFEPSHVDYKTCVNNNTEVANVTCIAKNANFYRNNTAPSKPKRSTSLNLSNGYIRSKGTLPCVPSVPSRSSSRATLPRHSIHSHHSSSNGDDFPHPLDATSQEIVPIEQPPVPPHRFLPFPQLPERTSSKHRDSPPVPKRVTSRALPTPPARFAARPIAPTLRPSGPPPDVPKEDLNLPTRSTSLADKFKRSNSLQAPPTSKVKLRNSCGDVMPNCRTSQTLLIHLKKMAQDEDESNNERSSPDQSPSEEVGLGTGWVRVAPLTDFTDSKNRANLLDSMMPSSEAGSTETDEDAARNRPQENLKTAQRNRRRKKALRHREDSHPRITYNRFDHAESSALNSFQFLDNLSSSSEEPIGPRCSPVSKFSENLDSLRSSEFCDSSVDFRCQAGEAPCGSDMINFFADPTYISPTTNVNLASTKHLPSITNHLSDTPVPPNIRLSNGRSNVTFRSSNGRTSHDTSSLTFSTCTRKLPNSTHRPSNVMIRPPVRQPLNGTPRPASFNSKCSKMVSDPLNNAYKFPSPPYVTNKPLITTPNYSSVDTNYWRNPKDEQMDSPPDVEDLSKTKIFERKNSLVYRIKEAFEKSNLQQKNVIKSGFEKDRLKSPNFKAVIDKFSQPNTGKVPVSIFSNKNDAKLNEKSMNATYIINKMDETKFQKGNNLTKWSPSKLKNCQTKQTCSKTAKIPLLTIKVGNRVEFSCDKGRVSISDSCAEVISPFSTDEEDVFPKDSFH